MKTNNYCTSIQDGTREVLCYVCHTKMMKYKKKILQFLYMKWILESSYVFVTSIKEKKIEWLNYNNLTCLSFFFTNSKL